MRLAKQTKHRRAPRIGAVAPSTGRILIGFQIALQSSKCGAFASLRLLVLGWVLAAQSVSAAHVCSGSNQSSGELSQEFQPAGLEFSDEVLSAQSLGIIEALLPHASGSDSLQDCVLEVLEERIGIEVSAEGFALLYDRVALARGDLQRFGSIPSLKNGRVESPPPEVYSPRRANLGLAPLGAYYDRIEAALHDGVTLRAAIGAPLALGSVVLPTEPALRRRLLELARRDQLVRRTADKNELERFEQEALSAIRSIVQEWGIPTIAEVGRSGVQSAWLLIQHADEDVAFMRGCLKLAKTAVERGDFSPVHYALLSDRVNVLSGVPQIYGTQFGADAEGRFIYRIADVEDVNQRRAEMQLAPIAESRLLQARFVDPAEIYPAARQH